MPGPVGEGENKSPTPREGRVAQYKVFWNKPTSRRVLVLQFPNRKKEDALNNKTGNKPLEIRLKPNTGLVEVDLPIRVDKSYDKARGVQFGHALKNSRVLQNKGDYGLAGGFGAQVQARGRANNSHANQMDTSEDTINANFEQAVRQGTALGKITLGGRIRSLQPGDPVYAIGAFQGDELHLTKIDAVCTLQPQFHHLDAVQDNERAASRANAPTDQGDTEARAVNMAVKPADGEGPTDGDDVGKTLRAIQEERWQRLEWVDEDADKSYTSYGDDLMMYPRFKNKRLVSTLTEKQYLDSISAPRRDPVYQGERVMRNRPHSPGGDSDLSSTDEEDNEAPVETSGSRLDSGAMEVDP